MARRKKRTLPKWSEMEADEILSLYPDEFLDCRTGHAWNKRGIWNLVGPEVWELSYGCACGAKKVSLVDDKTKRQIRHPYIRYSPGYLTPRTGLTRDDFRTGFQTRDFDRADKDGRVHRTYTEQESK